MRDLKNDTPQVEGGAEPIKIMRWNPLPGLGGMNPAANGLYVRYEDHAAALAAQGQEVQINQAVDKAWDHFEAVMDKGTYLPPPGIHAAVHYAGFLRRLAHKQTEPTKAGAIANAASMIDVLLQETRRLHRELIDAQGREAEPRPFDFAAHLARQAEFSARTFGPGQRTQGVCDHIRKELREIEAAPDDLSEWIDVAILALDGAWRIGATPTEIIAAMVAKQTKNEGRRWPDWHTADPSKAIEHDRGDEHLPSAQADADKRDAQRYRWLRDGTIDEDGNINDEIHVAVDSPEWPNQWALVAQDLDAAIDAALKKGGAA